MASRLDAIQVAVSRAPESAAQAHAAQRQPVVAQEQATTANRQAAAARQERPEAIARRDGGEVSNDLVPAVQGQDREPRRRSPRRRPASSASGSGGAAPDETLDGKGNLLDLRA